MNEILLNISKLIRNMTIGVITPPSEQISRRRKICDVYYSAGQDVVTSQTVLEQLYLKFINSFQV